MKYEIQVESQLFHLQFSTFLKHLPLASYKNKEDLQNAQESCLWLGPIHIMDMAIWGVNEWMKDYLSVFFSLSFSNSFK